MKRTIKRILSTVLVAVMLIGIAPMGGIDLAPKACAKDISSYSVGDTITYGSYPQSKVTDSNLIAKIEAAGEKYVWRDYNYYAGTGDAYDGNMKPVDGMMLYKDIPYGGSKYRAVKINQYRPRWTGYTSSSSNSYQDDNGYYTGNVYYFKYEPLTWRVLDPSEGYVMCNQIIDSQAYQNFIYYNGSEYYNSKGSTNFASDWVTSSLRQWLNNSFYNTAFSVEEKEQIGTSYLENRSTYSSVYNSANTYDKIYLISHDDATNIAYGFSSLYYFNDMARRLESTDYAKCQGNDKSNYWRLRTPAYTSLETHCVLTSGEMYSDTDNYIFIIGVVPAFKFNPKSTIPVSEINDVINEEIEFNKDKKVTINFKNSWFEKSPNKYNHELAQFCADYAMLGYKYDNDEVKTYLNKAGFYSFYSFNDEDAGRDEVNYFLASRDIVVNGKVQKLVFMGTIGSYKNQWFSNFDPLGRENEKRDNCLADGGKTHRGFADARDFAYEHLSNYINSLIANDTKKEDIKILLTGHSRGAATANLLAAKLIDEGSSSKLVSQGNVFAYTFATPNVTKNNATAKKYNCIFNIVNPEDFVTKVMLSSWGFSRYGITYTLPSKTNIGKKNYNNNVLPKVSSEFAKYTGKVFDPYKEGEKHTYKIISKMSSNVGSAEALYTDKFWYDNNGKTRQYKDTFTFFKNTLLNYLVNENMDEIIRILPECGPFFLSILAYFAWPDLNASTIFAGIANGSIKQMFKGVDVGGKFKMAHQMETYAAYMNTLSESELTEYKAGYKNTVNCPVDIEVYDKSTGELVGRIVNNVVDETVAAKENSIVMDVEGDSKSFWLPSNGDYDIKLIGNDNGKMDYTVAMIDSDIGEISRVNFFDVDIIKEQSMTGEVIADEFTLENYTLEKDEGEVLEPTEVQKDVESFEVKTSTDGNGYVTDSMTVTSGDYVTVSATPKEGYAFKGWYNGDKLVSSDNEYSFVAKNNITLTAKFAPIPKNVNSVSIDDISLNYKKSTTLKPTIKADDGVKYTVEYSTSNPKVATVDKNGKVTATKRGSGSATITCTVTDSNGNVVKDTCKVNVSLTWWQWIIIIVLFGWIWY